MAPTARFRYVPFDLRDVESLPRLVHEAEPDFAFTLPPSTEPPASYTKGSGEICWPFVATLHVLLSTRARAVAACASFMQVPQRYSPRRSQE